MIYKLSWKHYLCFQGSHFFYNNSGSQFLIRGAFYSDSGRTTSAGNSFIDVLADNTICSRDLPYFQRLGINTVIISGVDTTADHTSCMQVLQNAGIYVLVQLNGRVRTAYTMEGVPFVNVDYHFYDHFRDVVDGFQRYPNTLGFFTVARATSVFLSKTKTTMIYLKDYIRQKGYRSIPVGFMHEVFQQASENVPNQ
jgi:hypothetical protein